MIKSAAKQSGESLEVLGHERADTIEEFRWSKSVTVT
jgi:hypothetical protein